MPNEKIITVFLDEHIRVIHKPINICFHSDDDAQGVVSLVRATYPDETLFPIHRLDKMTSGLMIFARSTKANEALSKMLEEKKIEKYYLALSKQKPSKKQGAVIGDMTKGRRGSYLLLRDKIKPACTYFFTKSFLLNNERFWFFALKPETGKTHQLRVAMKSLASPVYGDVRYEKNSVQVGGDRGYLHAYKMRFDLFEKRYEICDENFTGKFFDLIDQSKNADIKVLLSPENLNWPKRAFKLT